jgi:putative nucleotidyltransferase with HDIG domain
VLNVNNVYGYWLMNNHHKRVIVLVLFAQIFLMVFTKMSVNTVTSYEEEKVGVALSAVLNITRQAIDSWADENINTAEVWADLPVTIRLTQDLLAFDSSSDLIKSAAQKEIRELLMPVFVGKRYQGFFILNLDGMNIASSRDNNLWMQNLTLDQPVFFNKLLGGESNISLPQISEVPLLNEYGDLVGNAPTMFVGAPIKDENSKVIAILLFRINPREDFTRIFQQGNLGNNGETYAFDSEALMISESRYDKELIELGLLEPRQSSILNIRIIDPGVNLYEDDNSSLPIEQENFTLMAKNAISGVSLNEISYNIEGYIDYRGVEVLGAWIWDTNFEIGIATEVDKQEYFENFHIILDSINYISYFASALLTLSTILYIISDRRAIKNTEKINLQLEHQRALRKIDVSIASQQNLEYSLNIVLDIIYEFLAVDAASIVLSEKINSQLQVVNYKGFRTADTVNLKLRDSESMAGKVISTARPLIVSDLSKSNLVSDPVLCNIEKFKSYFGQPLIAKGKVIGVLEVFMRSPFEPNPEWLELFFIFAGQATIAIDNATLFDNLNTRNEELRVAYDDTLEGWAKALELRDMETQGHSQRVTNLTNKLAIKMGEFSEKELDNIRRGALLHDIGKMGIPDSILLKPGKLTEEEWEIMKKHTDYAYKWLKPIAFLERSLDIPYAHHEKWDGTGYPLGLKGEEIPLAVRIFSIVDVWDALSSNRPYRKAWEKERILNYLQEEVGKHFDPKVYEAFQSLVEEENKFYSFQ